MWRASVRLWSCCSLCVIHGVNRDGDGLDGGRHLDDLSHQRNDVVPKNESVSARRELYPDGHMSYHHFCLGVAASHTQFDQQFPFCCERSDQVRKGLQELWAAMGAIDIAIQDDLNA